MKNRIRWKRFGTGEQRQTTAAKFGCAGVLVHINMICFFHYYYFAYSGFIYSISALLLVAAEKDVRTRRVRTERRRYGRWCLCGARIHVIRSQYILLTGTSTINPRKEDRNFFLYLFLSFAAVLLVCPSAVRKVLLEFLFRALQFCSTVFGHCISNVIPVSFYFRFA